MQITLNLAGQTITSSSPSSKEEASLSPSKKAYSMPVMEAMILTGSWTSLSSFSLSPVSVLPSLSSSSGFSVSGFSVSGFSVSVFSVSGFSVSVFSVSGFSVSGFSVSGFSVSCFTVSAEGTSGAGSVCAGTSVACVSGASVTGSSTAGASLVPQAQKIRQSAAARAISLLRCRAFIPYILFVSPGYPVRWYRWRENFIGEPRRGPIPLYHNPLRAASQDIVRFFYLFSIKNFQESPFLSRSPGSRPVLLLRGMKNGCALPKEKRTRFDVDADEEPALRVRSSRGCRRARFSRIRRDWPSRGPVPPRRRPSPHSRFPR